MPYKIKIHNLYCTSFLQNRIESYSQPESQPAKCDQFYSIFYRAVSNSRGEERESLKGCRTRIPMGI